jgi:hypothetical protein
MMQAWNSEMGAASKQVELLESLIPHDRKEMALTLFHENDYKINGKLFGGAKYRELNIASDYLRFNTVVRASIYYDVRHQAFLTR